MSRAKRVDANQAQIVSDLRELGASVADIHTVGDGVPDLLVAYRGWCLPVEIKTQAGRMTPDEVEFQENWRGPLGLLRSYYDEYILTLWLGGAHVMTVQLANLGDVLEAIERALE